MTRTFPSACMLATIGTLLLSACDTSPPAEPTPAATATSPSASAAPSPAPSLAAGELSEADKGETGARALLLDWARAIELRHFDEAWDLMSEADHRKWSRDDFAALFADLGEITVAVPGGTMEGAAGSLYYTEPVTITAPDSEGRPVRLEGEIVLRRVNDVPGATAEQLRWHVESTSLDWTH